MNRHRTAFVLCSCLLAMTIALAGHAQYRIIGTVTKVTATSVEVKQTRDGRIISIDVDDETKFTRDKKKVNRSELTVGASVVVDACGDSLKDLWAMEIRLLPTPAAKE